MRNKRHIVSARLGSLLRVRVLAFIAIPVATPAVGCVETQQAADGAPSPRDAGGWTCDAVANNWQVQNPGKAVETGSKGVKANLFAVWGAGPNAIFAVGDKGKVIFYDGKGWVSQATPVATKLTSVWGTSASNVWAVGYGGEVIHFNGKDWQRRSPPPGIWSTADGGPPKGDAAVATQRNLQGVWVTGKGKTEALYAVGDRGLVLHWDGSKQKNRWSSQIPITAGTATQSDSGATDAASGTKGKEVKVKDQLNAVWGAGAKQVFIVGDFGTILVGSKSGLVKQKTGITKDLIGVWGRSNSEVYAVGIGGTILRYKGGTAWESADKGNKAPNQVFRGIWGPANAPSVTYIIGWDGVLLRMSGGPGFTKGAKFSPFYCTAPRHRLEGIWGTMVAAGKGDAGGSVPAIWVVGASGMVITGP